VRDRRDDTGVEGSTVVTWKMLARKKRGLLGSGHLEEQPSRVASATMRVGNGMSRAALSHDVCVERILQLVAPLVPAKPDTA